MRTALKAKPEEVTESVPFRLPTPNWATQRIEPVIPYGTMAATPSGPTGVVTGVRPPANVFFMPLRIDRVVLLPPDFNSQLRLQLADVERLTADWDGQGSPPYTAATIDRAVRLASGVLAQLWDSGLRVTPVMGPGPNGAIDIHWRTDRFELLVTVPRDPAAPAVYYGDNFGDFTAKGTLDTTRGSGPLADWLSRAAE